jgi:hypothetical protein
VPLTGAQRQARYLTRLSARAKEPRARPLPLIMAGLPDDDGPDGLQSTREWGQTVVEAIQRASADLVKELLAMGRPEGEELATLLGIARRS